MRRPPLVYLDTNVFIRGIKGNETEAAPVQRLLNLLRDFPEASITSELTLAELLAPTGRAGTLPLSIKEPLYLDLIVSGNFIVLHPVARDILILTAQFDRGSLRSFLMPSTLQPPLKLDASISCPMTVMEKGCRRPFVMSFRTKKVWMP